MKAWGHVTAKRTYVLSNSHLIKSLDSGAMKRKELYSEVSTTDRYESQDGRKRFKGNANLKGTQFLSLQFYFFSLVSQMSIYSIDTSRLRARVKKMIPAFWISADRLYPWPHIGKLLEMSTEKPEEINPMPQAPLPVGSALCV